MIKRSIKGNNQCKNLANGEDVMAGRETREVEAHWVPTRLRELGKKVNGKKKIVLNQGSDIMRNLVVKYLSQPRSICLVFILMYKTNLHL